MLQAFPAPAKINLFLHITGRRSDGYHLLQSVFRFLDYGDTIHLETRNDGIVRRPHQVEGVAEEHDLTVRAARLLQSVTGCRLGADIHVEKRIPMGGGLGGGSSDAATIMLALNRLWNLGLTRQQMMDLGLQLGADVPVFIFGESAWAEGIGEQLQPIVLERACYAVLTPPVHVSTPAIFASRELTRDTIPARIAAFSRGFGHNDLESVVCRTHPEVASCLTWLKQYGDARMSGSGASVFVELPSMEAAEKVVAEKPVGVRGFAARGLDFHPLRENANERLGSRQAG